MATGLKTAAGAAAAALAAAGLLGCASRPEVTVRPVRPPTVSKKPEIKRPAVRLNQLPGNLESGIAIDAREALPPRKGPRVPKRGALALAPAGPVVAKFASRPIKPALPPKIAFLTFDDGPSPVTPRVLATLAKNHIKATFFVVGRMAAAYPSFLKKEFQSGHAIGNHSYTHEYKAVYRTPWTMIAEIVKTEAILERTLGPTFRTSLFRFPGGYMGNRSVFHHHKQSYVAALDDAGMHFIDWNVDCGDTQPKPLSSSQLVARVMSEAGNSPRIVVLMHDAGAKEKTARALPQIIAGLKKRGYVFRTLR